MTKTLSSSEQEFLLAWSQLQPMEILDEYRAYYNQEGKVLFYAANNFPTEGLWINIDRETYVKQNYHWQWVVDLKLIERLPTSTYRFSLIKSDSGQAVVKDHAGLVIEADDDYSVCEHYKVKEIDDY